jgi:hypothetical protein
MVRTRRRITALSFALAVLTASGITVVVFAASPAGAFTRGEGTGKAWCADYGGQNIGSYRDIYACKPDKKNAGRTPFDSFPGFQPTELANRFLFKMTGHTLFDNEVAGNFVALASATYAIPDASAGTQGVVPAAGDVISMWGGRSGQKQNGDRTLVAVVTHVAAVPSGWTITTLNEGEQADTSGVDGFDTIAVSDGGRTWDTERGFYRSFDWLRLAAGSAQQAGNPGNPGGGNPGGGNPGGGSPGSGSNPGGGTGHGSGHWTAAQAPRLPVTPTSQLASVACGSAADCTAVGTSGHSGILITRSGSNWTAAPVPVPASSVTATSLATVACPSADACVAGGHYSSSGRQQGLLLAGYGRSWTATRAPLPANAAGSPDASVLAVACAAASSCVAVGQYSGGSSDYALLLTGHGSSWTGWQAPVPADAAARPAAELVSVACPSVAACTAVGSYIDTAGNRQGMFVTERGTAWTASRSPLPAGATVPGARLSAVTCPQSSACVAVGEYSATTRGFVVRGSGTSWTATQTPLPAGATASRTATFHSVTCASVSTCIATGSYTDAAGSSQGLLVTSQGQKLTAVAAPMPAGAAPRQGQPGAALVSVACAATSCAAVGQYTDTDGDAQMLLLTGYGSSWQPASAPVPPNAKTVGSQAQGVIGPPTLASVACPVRSACVAVGSYPTRTLGTEGLVITGAA